MKRFVPLLLVIPILIAGVFYLNHKPTIADGSEVAEPVRVTDRAMSGGLPYLGVVCVDGTELCLWDVQGGIIPDSVSIGDTIQVTYGKQSGFDRYILLEVGK